MMKKLKRYFRKTIAHPEGTITHDGDCMFWSIGVCTCGLLHLLRPLESPQKYYKDFSAEVSKHDTEIAKINYSASFKKLI